MRAVTLPCCLTVALFAFGCWGGGPAADAPELFEAFGTVTLDGEPLKDAHVLFKAENKPPTTGRTDEKGYYVIQYNVKYNGAFPGKNVVRINIGDEDSDADDEDDAAAKRARGPKLLAIYNSRTTLSEDVKKDGAPYDFELKSK